MKELTCPNCKKAFKVDEAGFADLLKQVRDEEFARELEDRFKIAEKEKLTAVQLAESDMKSRYEKMISEKDSEISLLKSQSELELQKQINSKDSEILKLQTQLDAKQKDIELAVTNAVRVIEKERDDFKNQISLSKTEWELQEKSLLMQHQEQLKRKDDELKYKDETIERYKDFKQKLSTKMLGETLEQHCLTEFNKLRPYAFRSSYFGKDNDPRTGSKGDFIFREHDEYGNEILSIMFEMKNEGDETVKKQKNEDFLDELHKDRNEKKCEYAILVTVLESDSEYYNCGIVDVSHLYPKMYVVRPQFFIPIITLLRNSALNAAEYRTELAHIRNQNIDITNFENKVNTFKEGFAKNYLAASKHFEMAITEIDNSIKKMEKVKDELRTSINQLRLANQKADDLTIKKLTYGNPTMKSKFNDLKKQQE